MAFRDKLRSIITLKEPPHRIALAFSIGVFIGMSPFLGFHAILGAAIAWVFRLNIFAILVGINVTNPWTIVPIYTFCTWIGAQCLGKEQIIPEINWSNINFSYLLDSFKPILLPFVFGTLLVGSLTAIVSYIVIYNITKRSHRLQ